MIAGIVLAAGQSSRLGRPKQLLPLEDEPLIRYTVRRILTSALDEVLVVVGHQAAAVTAAIADLPVRVILNPDAALGQSTSVRAGLANLSSQSEAAVFLLGDQPGIDPRMIDALIAVWRETRAPVVAPRYSDGIGNPVLFDRSVFPKLALLEGDSGARPVVHAHQSAGALLLVPVDQPMPRDVDTEADYAALLASLQPKRGAFSQTPPLSAR